ncbi:MAG TPA: M28 family peptidase [Chthoniobacteraceae bacterium]|nr:M28 family peptidase [Chthoniobacteraceae bacterium]
MRLANWKVAALAVVALAACNRKPASTQGPAPTPVSTPEVPSTPVRKESTPAKQAKVPPPPPPEIWKLFSGERAFADVRQQIEIGPRPSGSAEIEKARAHISGTLSNAGWQVERQEFADTTPRGPINFVNLIARYAPGDARPVPTNTQRAIVCSHYDTKRFSTIKFVGAHDGASSTGALLELARVLALDPVLATQIELVFFDGEEALTQFTETDGLYGSRHYASKLRETDRAKQFQFGILWDMIGDKDLTITLPPDSPRELANAILQAAETLGVRDRFSFYERNVYDDHVPLNSVARVPTIDLIDFDYPPWHTADDTLDKLSPESLQNIGAVTLYHLRKAFSK